MIQRPLDKLTSILMPEYHHSTNLITYITAFAELQQEIHIALEDTKVDRYLEEAVGNQLDDIGIIVGLPRGAANEFIGVLFGFNGALGAETFGTVGDTEVGGFFKSRSTEEFNKVTLSDDNYRGHLKAKILTNFKGLTIENIMDVVENIFGFTDVVITEEPRKFNIHFPYDLDINTQVLLATPGFIPKPLGTTMTLSDNSGQITG